MWREGHLSRYLEEASVRETVPQVHIANWRQVDMAILKINLVSQIEQFEPGERDEDAEETAPIIRITSD